MKVNLNQELNKETVEALYGEYQSYITPVVAIAISILLLIFILVPQFFSLSQKKNAAGTESTKLDKLTAAKDLASTTDVVKLSSDLSLANSVLPSSKDFQSIINTLSTTADASGVSIDSYQFANAQAQTAAALGNFPSVAFTVNLNATPAQTMDFISKLSQTAPLSEVQSLTGTDTTSTLTIVFFYKPFSSVNENTDVQVRKMNPSESSTLDKISQWNISTFEQGNLPASTTSAQENNSPFSP